MKLYYNTNNGNHVLTISEDGQARTYIADEQGAIPAYTDKNLALPYLLRFYQFAVPNVKSFFETNQIKGNNGESYEDFESRVLTGEIVLAHLEIETNPPVAEIVHEIADLLNI